MQTVLPALPAFRSNLPERFFLAIVLVLSLIATLGVAGGRFNTSSSAVPAGLYWTTGEPVVAGTVVRFCPPPGASMTTAKERGYIAAGFCPGGYGSLIKRVLAVGGDTVSVSADGVTVNGEQLPYSQPLDADAAGRPLSRYRMDRPLRASELLLMSTTNGESFDGRYFGPIHRSQVQDVLRPIATW